MWIDMPIRNEGDGHSPAPTFLRGKLPLKSGVGEPRSATRPISRVISHQVKSESVADK